MRLEDLRHAADVVGFGVRRDKRAEAADAELVEPFRHSRAG